VFRHRHDALCGGDEQLNLYVYLYAGSGGFANAHIDDHLWFRSDAEHVWLHQQCRAVVLLRLFERQFADGIFKLHCTLTGGTFDGSHTVALSDGGNLGRLPVVATRRRIL